MRIFTPAREVPFAGHPTLGTAFVLAAPLQLGEIRIETGRGVVPVRLEREGARISFGRMEQPLPEVESFADADELLAALGVALGAAGRVLRQRHPARVRRARLARTRSRRCGPTRRACSAFGEVGVNCFAGEGVRWKTRMFAPGHGVAEDPATGSAAGPLALHLARHGRIGWGEEIEISQGVEVGRPSTLYARVVGSPSGRADRGRRRGGGRRPRRVPALRLDVDSAPRAAVSDQAKAIRRPRARLGGLVEGDRTASRRVRGRQRGTGRNADQASRPRGRAPSSHRPRPVPHRTWPRGTSLRQRAPAWHVRRGRVSCLGSATSLETDTEARASVDPGDGLDVRQLERERAPEDAAVASRRRAGSAPRRASGPDPSRRPRPRSPAAGRRPPRARSSRRRSRA